MTTEKKIVHGWHIVVCYSLLFFAMSSALFFLDKGAVVLYVNGMNTAFLDQFNKYITYLGDGLIFLPLFLMAIFTNRKKYTIRIVLIFVLHAIVLLLFKQVLFKSAGRPISFFDNPELLHFVEGVDVHSRKSFPSGHTASAFAVSTVLAFMYRSRIVLVSSLFIALFVGISRIYLLQHFYFDVVVGAIIGFLSSIIISYLPVREFAWKPIPWAFKRLFRKQELVRKDY